ncbi:MAG: helix-hairpin-helix domain-containing protein [Sphingobium sp.]
MTTFSPAEQEALLALKGVGPSVVMRLEQLGITDFDALAGCDAQNICDEVAASLGTTCWRNSPQARAAIAAAIMRAQEGL